MRKVALPLAVGLVVLSLSPAAAGAAERPPEGVEQIIPRGRIAAITDPSFVPATEAEIPDAAWVLGVEVDGQARAYSLSLLNSHEVVNDRIGEHAYAAVW